MLPSFAPWFTGFKTVLVFALWPFLPMWVLFSASMGISMGKWQKAIKWPKITFTGSKMVPKVSTWVLGGGICIEKWSWNIDLGTPSAIFGVFGYFGGTENGTLGARTKILRSLFITNTPPKPPIRHFGNHNGPRKSDFWPSYWFSSFSHWNFHWSRNFFWEGLPIELERKRKPFWNPYGIRNGIR